MVTLGKLSLISTVCVRDPSHHETIIVVRGLKNDLLGLPALTALQLNAISLNDIIRIGKFGEPYYIQLRGCKTTGAVYNVAIP
jgi:hypothetical protein